MIRVRNCTRCRAVVVPASLLQLRHGCARSTPSFHSTSSSPRLKSVAQTRPEQASDPLASWNGVYTSPAEIGSFSGTALILDKRKDDHDLFYRMRFYTDSRDVNEIQEDEKFGSALADGEQLFLPEASAKKED